ncbi:MAG: RNA polymerase sigma factor [Sphingobacteriia bacterium]|nr:RNA polymerase sigma factor [Sphingobacteriia bacterium]
MTEEQDLIKACLKGDSKALESFYDRYAPMLLGTCMRYIPVRVDAEDLLQEALIKIMSNLRGFDFRGKGSIEAWMKRIIVNLSLNFLRNKTTKNIFVYVGEESLLDLNETRETELDTTDLSIEEIYQLIGALPVGYRTILNLYVFEKYSHQEIATMLGCTEGNSKSQLLRARALLKKQIKELRTQKEALPVYGN